jgi:hypothetical protein
LRRRPLATAIAFAASLVVPKPALAEAPVSDSIRVFYDGEPCEGEWIDLEVFDRAARVWVAHPEHPRIPVESCQHENPGRLLNELRWRCVTPEGAAPWRHFQVFQPGVLSRCEHEEILEGERQRIRDARRKRLDLRIESDLQQSDPQETDPDEAGSD